MQIRYILAIAVVCSTFLLLIVVSESYFTYADRVNQVETITVGSTVSTSQLQQQTLINRVFKVISTTGTNYPCETYSFTFNGNQGQYVSGNFTSDIPLDFYIVQNSTYQSWLKAGSCGSGTEAITSQLNTMSYSFDVAIPTSGPWDIVLVNRSNARDADGSIAAYLSSGSYTTTKPLLSTVTTTTSSFFTNTSSSSAPSIPGFPIESIAVGILAGIVALLILRNRRRDHEHGRQQ